MNKITVIITHEDLADCLSVDSLIIDKLGAAGIPAKFSIDKNGAILFDSISSGV